MCLLCFQHSSHQPFHLYRLAVMLLLSLSFTSTISVGARTNLVIAFPDLSPGLAVPGQHLCRTVIVLTWVIYASIDLVLAFFLPQLSCGTLYLLMFFLPLTICLPLNVGFTDTLGLLTNLFSFNFFSILVFYCILFYSLYFIDLVLYVFLDAAGPRCGSFDPCLATER